MSRLARIGTGYALIAAGTVMLVTPGPGLVTIAGGLALLSEDVAWAGRATNWIKSKAARSAPSTDDGEARNDSTRTSGSGDTPQLGG